MRARADEVGPAPLLRMHNLRIAEATTDILKGVDLSLCRGQVLGIIGESGAGKSTLGLAALGYVRPGCHIASGEVIFDGENLLQLGQEKLQQLRGARIAYVAQSAAASFNPTQRLIRQCMEPALLHRDMNRGVARERVIDLFRQLGLPDPERFGQRYPHQVSGGQLQRAMIAMAMVCRPDLIVFDEPTTALDVTTQIEVLAAVRHVIKREGTAALYISHDLAVVAQVADRILVLRHGAVVEQGNVDELLAAPKQEYTRQLVTSRMLGKEEKKSEQAPLLRLESITGCYGRVRVVDDVSMEIPSGRTVALVGESGSGKSTLARIITGLTPAAAGRIFFRGIAVPPSLKHRERSMLRQIQLIPQMPDTALNPRHRIREILGRPLTLYYRAEKRVRDFRIHELLDMTELAPATIDRYPGELSGGQKQRVCIARALAANPDLIICDEITSALDPLVAKGILALLLRLQSELQVSYLLITHDLTIVQAIADRIVIMQRGNVVDQGARSEVLSPPRHAYTAQLLSSVPQMDSRWLTALLENRASAREAPWPAQSEFADHPSIASGA